MNFADFILEKPWKGTTNKHNNVSNLVCGPVSGRSLCAIKRMINLTTRLFFICLAAKHRTQYSVYISVNTPWPFTSTRLFRVVFQLTRLLYNQTFQFNILLFNDELFATHIFYAINFKLMVVFILGFEKMSPGRK